jgi:hypothetical protein
MATSRPSRTRVWRQLVGWIAAYAFVLHTAFAGIVATQFAIASAKSAGFEICLTGPDGSALPGHTQGQHENCAIHCATIAGAVPALALALLALLFPPRAPLRPRQFVFSRSFKYLRRAGLSRAPPLSA